MTQTPLQELLKKLSEGDKSVYGRSQIVEMIQSLLPKEKEFVNKVWNAGATSGYDNKRVHGTSEWDKEGHAANFIDFINEIYPKQ